MIKSLYQYAINLYKIAKDPTKRKLIRGYFDSYFFAYKPFLKHPTSPKFGEEKREDALNKSISWLLHSQSRMKDDGMGSYHLTKGWTSSYPETTGYIIPTLLEYAEIHKDDVVEKQAIAAADWLLSIQKPSGGWQGGYVDEKCEEIVFNTGQIIRGMIAAYKTTNDEKYLASAQKAGDWLCSIQEFEGSWKKGAYRGVERVYDSYVDAPLLMIAHYLEKKKYQDIAIKNLNWILQNKVHFNGWFEDCDNTIKHNDKPITHTLAYTIDGLWQSGVMLKNDKYKRAAMASANELLTAFNKNNFLNGRYNKNWEGSESLITTGSAQLSIIWAKLYIHTKDTKYRKAAMKMNDLLIYIQQLNYGMSEVDGAMPGSYPIWGKYEPFSFPNWATKYFADALMYEQKMNEIS